MVYCRRPVFQITQNVRFVKDYEVGIGVYVIYVVYVVYGVYVVVVVVYDLVV